MISKSILILKIFIKNDRECASSKLSLSFWKKLYCLKRGFLIDKYNLYNFKKNDSRLYVSDIYDLMSIPKNGFYQKIIDNKAFLPIILKEFHQYIPAYYFSIYKPSILDHVDNKYIDFNEFLIKIYSILEKKGNVVLKPFSKENGAGFIMLSRINGKLSLNNKDITENDLKNELSKLDNYICTEIVENVSYLKEIYPYSLNTIRFLTIFDFKENKHFIAMAVQKFGINPEMAIDSGVSSEIDLKTGKLCMALWPVKIARLKDRIFIQPQKLWLTVFK